MKIPTYVIMLILVIAISMGTVLALEVHTSPPVIIDQGNLNVLNGQIIMDRSDGIAPAITMKAKGAAMGLKFHDTDPETNQEYLIRLTQDGKNLWFIDQTHGNRIDIAVKTATGNIGIGTNLPDEKLDINGNLKLSGTGRTITSDGDICIGNCP